MIDGTGQLTTETLIELLNPSIALVLAVAFLLMWTQNRTRPYIAVLAGGYALMALGFLLHYNELPIGFYPTKFLSNLTFLTSGVMIGSAVVRRYGRPAPYGALLLLAVSGMAAMFWFMAFEPSLTWRIIAMNFALGGMAFVVADALRKAGGKTALDRALLAASLFCGLNLIVRTTVLVVLDGGYQTYDGFYTSTYWTSSVLSHAILSLIIAICVIMTVATDTLETLRMQAHTDPLSGLLNRRGFEERARLSIATSHRRATPLSLVLADLDHFKAVNDAHGHSVGDAVIAAFSSLLRGTGVGSSITGRTGGEEFAILVPSCDLQMARLLAEGLRTALSEGMVDGVPQEVGRVTASFGVAALASGEDLDALVRRADEALYQAKRDGRNLVRQARSDANVLAATEVVDPIKQGNERRAHR